MRRLRRHEIVPVRTVRRMKAERGASVVNTAGSVLPWLADHDHDLRLPVWFCKAPIAAVLRDWLASRSRRIAAIDLGLLPSPPILLP